VVESERKGANQLAVNSVVAVGVCARASLKQQQQKTLTRADVLHVEESDAVRGLEGGAIGSGCVCDKEWCTVKPEAESRAGLCYPQST
jgi:hypothetical protein